MKEKKPHYLFYKAAWYELHMIAIAIVTVVFLP